MEVTTTQADELMRRERIDADRLAWLVFSATELSEHGYVLIRWATKRTSQINCQQWRVNVRWHGHEHTSTATPETESIDKTPALVLALDRAVQWLRAACATIGLLILCALPVAAEGPQYVLTAPGVSPCMLSWQTGDHFKVYLSTTKGQLGPLFATVPGQNTSGQTPCPTTPGQYYWQVSSQVGAQPESPPSLPAAFVILDPNAPPPITFAVGVGVEVTALLLNVRPSPAGACLIMPCPTQPKGARAAIVEGPVTVTTGPNAGVWWKLDYTSGSDGWGMEKFLKVVQP
jgi:hypothetical protein